MPSPREDVVMEPPSSRQWTVGLGLLDAGNYIAVNRDLIRAVGLNAAVLLGELASEARYWNSRGEMRDGWFFSTIQNVTDMCGLSKYHQADAIKVLSDAGLIEVSYSGLPRSRHIRINGPRVLRLIDQSVPDNKLFTESTTSGQQSGQLAVNRVDANNHKKQEDISLSGEVDYQPSRPTTYNSLVSSGFVPPTLDEVKDFFAGNDLRYCDPEVFFSWHEARSWVVNGSPITNWRMAAQSWNVRERNNRASQRAKEAASKPDYSEFSLDKWKKG